MKKLFLISILVSLAWGQYFDVKPQKELYCQIDGFELSKKGDSKYIDGKQVYLWECKNYGHKYWLADKAATPRPTILPDYSPVIDAMKDKRTPEERKKQEEEYADGWEEGLAWNAMMKEKHPILLKVFQGVVLYGCYLLIQGEID